jgi:hypothetical protein
MWLMPCLKALKRNWNGIAAVDFVTSFRVNHTMFYTLKVSLGTVNTM